MVRDILLHHVAYANPYRLREPISLTRQLTSVPAGKVMMDGTPQYIDNGKDGFKVDGAIESCCIQSRLMVGLRVRLVRCS
jgi:hypothetical protein